MRDRRLGVLGGTPQSVRYAQIVRQWTENAVFFARAGSLTSVHRSQLTARGIDVVEDDVKQVMVENDQLSGVELDNGRTVRLDALFVPPRFVPNNDLLSSLGCATDEDGWAVTDATGHTSVVVCGPQATSVTLEPRSSPPRDKGRRQPLQ